MSFFRSMIFKTAEEGAREKQKDYRNVVLIQIVILVLGLTLTEPVLEDSKSGASKFIITIFLSFAATYQFLLWDLLRNFTNNKILINGIFIILLGLIITGTLGEFPYYEFVHFADRRMYLFTVHGILFPVELTLIGFTIRDIFSGKFLTSDKLWGAACVYLMIGISFGSLYDLINIYRPGSLGLNVELGFPNYSECVSYSFCILGGVDPGVSGTSHFIRNISILEGIWGALYAMLIIGKLLGLPRPDPETEAHARNSPKP